MIKLNLLDESEMPKETDLSSPRAAQEKIKIRSKKDKWLVIGPVVIGALWLGYLGYFFFLVRAPLANVKEEKSTLEKSLQEVAPKVAEAETLEAELAVLRKELNEFELYLESKQNWARVLNILSDALPDEIVFTNLSVAEMEYQTKVITDAGVTIQKLVTDRLSINISLPEDASGKVASYSRKLEKHPVLAPMLAGIETGGLLLSNKRYTTTLNLYLNKYPAKGDGS